MEVVRSICIFRLMSAAGYPLCQLLFPVPSALFSPGKTIETKTPSFLLARVRQIVIDKPGFILAGRLSVTLNALPNPISAGSAGWGSRGTRCCGVVARLGIVAGLCIATASGVVVGGCAVFRCWGRRGGLSLVVGHDVWSIETMWWQGQLLLFDPRICVWAGA